ncbi:unnamed protein product [Arabidopsis thaliana]|uniref:Uncharacterized protein n=2 Tax=Arabidopsis thaliana TaxID=3702 RepID=A0A654FM87_ARATH|nr:uncharacterized protein AT4G07995 [Arabidopsis thaliana]ANM68125.1 hypothetical protein AT4G07995 [Arabidopsis thaliana]CAA0394024.1 unnamed protein product [Arabidopsis thaliana]VYS61965.1 unnamed protein product [Arabidopsis thaliana]|eukprot:NP_001329902.1 hypothetical protein AT4G07995 [Arabidopsis thaliana]
MIFSLKRTYILVYYQKKRKRFQEKRL